MAGVRSKFNTLITALPTTFPDNNTGLITPAILRDFLESFLLTCQIPAVSLTQTVPGAVVALTAAWSTIPVAVWGAASVDPSGNLTAGLGTGKVTGQTAVTALDYEISGNAAIAGLLLASIDIGLFRNGVAPAIPLTSITLAGAAKFTEGSFLARFLAQPTSTFWEIGLKAPGGAINVTVNAALLDLQLSNTW